MTVGGHVIAFGGVTHVMGVINTSPESQNPHTVVESPEEALGLARRYRSWGATLVDVGGQSSRFEAPLIDDAAEIDRVCPTVEVLADDGFVVSVDTWKPKVAEAAIAAGASIVNDTGGLGDPEMRQVVSTSTAGVVAVHVDGDNPHDVDRVLLEDKASYTADIFEGLIAELHPSVVDRLILDPGIAINYRGDYAAYTRMQLEVIRRSDELHALGRPLLVPIPRKRDIHWVVAYITLALENAADIVRVHDVAIASGLCSLWGRTAG